MLLAASLLLLLQAPEKPVRSPVRDGLVYLLDHQRVDGSWGAPPPACKCRHAVPPDPALKGGDLETTSWALLALMGAGYSELSNDNVGGHHAGNSIRAGLDWLIARQDREGAFDRDHPAENALATLVLTETYGMTTKRRESAQMAYYWVQQSPIEDVVGRIRQGMVLQSGKLAEIGLGHDARLRASAAALETQEGELAKTGSLLLKGYSRVKAVEKPALEFGKAEPLKLAPECLDVFASASFLLGDQDRWHEWFKGLKEALLPLQRNEEQSCEKGSWNGESFRERLQVTAMRCLTLEHYRCWYCRNVFRKK